VNTHNYTVNEQIYTLVCNIRKVVKMAYANYEIGSREFVELINSAKETKKKIDALKEKGDSEEETLNRPNVFLAKNTTNKTKKL